MMMGNRGPDSSGSVRWGKPSRGDSEQRGGESSCGSLGGCFKPKSELMAKPRNWHGEGEQTEFQRRVGGGGVANSRGWGKGGG
ncbi:hypothetical protein TIFTF001_027653 [Ficus carica]|uniref:Uncharacterized protein n=1 Tax=Ficus carica TaxID=3494 RepID=A0AA88B1Q5_FICCA|nr:hypothetical protein TIFTF001_025965 [Ficus carica]GMN58556.1 hypothetical protein TIFTF001_027653 [Ficus carica]